jgi:beta-glucosidase
VHFDLTAEEAGYWNTDAQAWTLGAGTYTVRVGDSSRSLPVSGTFAVTNTNGPRYTKVSAPAVATPGSTISVSTTFTNGATQPVQQAHTALNLPAGWTGAAQTPASFAQVPAGGSVSTTWQVSVPADAHGGATPLTATTAYAGSDALPPGTGTATVNVAYANLAAAFDTVGVTDDTNPLVGNLDGSGYSFSAQALASVGVTPGGGIGGFTWPNVPAGQADVVTTSGQIVAQSGSGSTLAFLAVGTNGTQSGTVTVTYTDGSTSSGTITAADWYNNAAVPGCTLVVTAPYWNRPVGSTLDPNHHVSLYATSVPLSVGKQIAYVTLPNNGRLHIFATALH